MDKQPEELLFEFLRDTLYSPEHAALTLSDLPEQLQKLGAGLTVLHDFEDETRRFAMALARGDLTVPLPSAQNPLAAPLKALHGALSHVSWQITQVADGDYSQRLDFMGEFSDSFNRMTLQLYQREQALKQSQQMFISLTENMREWIVVQNGRGEIVYTNHAARVALDANEELAHALPESLSACPDSALQQLLPWECRLPATHGEQIFSVSSQLLTWEDEEDAVAHVLRDVTAARESEQQMRAMAYQDPLTHLFNRRYGLQAAEDWARDNIPFCICFADIDGLKYVNDTFGHEEGDAYIREVAKTLSALPTPHILCRIGGDEFLALLQNKTTAAMHNALEELRTRLGAQPFAEGRTAYPRSFSFGVAEFAADGSFNLSELLASADRQMYHYKFAHKMNRE